MTELAGAHHSEHAGKRRVLLPVAKFLPHADMRLLFRALTVVLLVRSALWLMTSTRLHSLLMQGTRRTLTLSELRVERMSWAVSAAATLVPGATCLTQALALQRLLHRSGEHSLIQVGFLRKESGEVHGHAWLEWRGQTIIGGRSSASFTSLMVLEGGAAGGGQGKGPNEGTFAQVNDTELGSEGEG
ncbi:MAG: lasso peptide biosynthesis B2 protein [Trueperaceae bacterium]